MSPMFSKHVFKRGLALCAVGSIAFFGSAEPAHSADLVALVSITGIELGKNEFVEGIALKTRNLRVLAACHIPAGWSVSISSPAGPTGAIEAGASGGVAALGPSDLGELRAVFLMRKSNIATADITGIVDIEIRGDQPDTAEKPLNSSNFVMEAADQCPAVGTWNARHK